MTMDDYQKRALATAIDEGSELMQRVLGLVGRVAKSPTRSKNGTATMAVICKN